MNYIIQIKYTQSTVSESKILRFLVFTGRLGRENGRNLRNWGYEDRSIIYGGKIAVLEQTIIIDDWLKLHSIKRSIVPC